LRAGKKLAVAVIHRDLEGVRAEVEFEKAIATTNERAGRVGRARVGV
jgi:apoptosis-inducing factor 3